MLHWIAIHIGADHSAGNSVFYNFWSGFGSDLGEATLLGAVLAGYRHRNCHEPRCWRLGHPVVDESGSTHLACHRHHPHHPRRSRAHKVSVTI